MIWLNYLPYLFTFLSGLFIGSFLNVVSDRLENGKSIFFGRSECDECKHKLGAKNLIPLLSFLIQKGKCSYCDVKLSYYYPLSELITGFTFLLVAIWLQIFSASTIFAWVNFLFYLVMSSFMIIIFLSDLKYMIVPDKIVFPAIILTLIYRILSIGVFSFVMYRQLSSDTFGQYLIKAGYLKNQVMYYVQDFGVVLLSSIIIALFFLFLIFITKGRGMGGGDVKLGLLIGLLTGFPKSVVAIFLAFFLGAVISLLLIALKKKTMKETIPFGPFLIIGFYVALFIGDKIIALYLRAL